MQGKSPIRLCASVKRQCFFKVLLDHVFSLISKGLKICLNVKHPRVDACASVYKLAAAVPAAEEKTSFIDTATRTVECLADDTFLVKTKDFQAVPLLKKELVQKEIVLLETNKIGWFTVLSNQEYQRKAEVAFSKLFRIFNGSLKNLKKMVCEVVCKANLQTLGQNILGEEEDQFTTKLLLKDHKVGFPMLVVANKRGTWQRLLSNLLQSCLRKLVFPNWLGLTYSDELVKDLQLYHGKHFFVIRGYKGTLIPFRTE